MANDALEDFCRKKAQEVGGIKFLQALSGNSSNNPSAIYETLNKKGFYMSCEYAGECREYKPDSPVCNQKGGFIPLPRGGSIECVHKTDNLRESLGELR